MISHITFQNCRVHILSDNLSRNSIFLADFVKTNLTNVAAICVKKGSKGRFFAPNKLENRPYEGKGKKKEKERKRKKGGEEKKKKSKWLHS